MINPDKQLPISGHKPLLKVLFLGFVTASLLALGQILNASVHSTKLRKKSVDSEAASGNSCNESVYAFESRELSILKDKQQWEECGINQTTATSRSQPIHEPRIRTQCGWVEAILISKQAEIRTDNDRYLVPNIVHYILYGDEMFTFLHYLSFKSSDRFIRPKYLFVHGDYDIGADHGYWWRKMLDDVPNVYYVRRPNVKSIQGRKPRSVEHAADIVRLHIIKENGGIYLDTDVIVLKSFDPLREKYALTLGHSYPEALANGIIISAPHQPFICVWYHSYREYNKPRKDWWNYFSVKRAYTLSKLFPGHVHVESRSLMHPSFVKEELPLMFNKYYDLSNNYAIHVWKRKARVPSSPEEMGKVNSTLTAVMRRVYQME